jgi:hypothetical protein
MSIILFIFTYNKLKITIMNIQDQISLVEKEVKGFYEANTTWCKLENLSENEKSHIIRIGTSILCTKWKIGYEGGGFVQAFVSNNLMGALGQADDTTIKGLKFFSGLVYNIGKPMKLCQLELNAD